MAGGETRILVTGANGFVGRHLCQYLAQQGVAYRAAVRSLDRARIPELDGADVVAVGEIGPRTEWAAALDKCSHVIHSAGRAHVLRETADDPTPIYEQINCAGSVRLAEAAITAGVTRLVYVSSILVNGQASMAGHPFTEETPPAPDRPYSLSKLHAENALVTLTQGTSLALCRVRPTVIYGPYVTANFYNMVHAIGRGIPLPFGLLPNRRTCVGVRNFAAFLLTCTTHPSGAGELFLAADREAVTFGELARRIGAALGKPARLLHMPPVLLKWIGAILRKPTLYTSLVSPLEVRMSKAERLLGWTQPYTLDEELQNLAAWYWRKVGAKN